VYIILTYIKINSIKKTKIISSYRLGDLVLVGLNEIEQNDILREHPDSIGSKYILEKIKNNYHDNVDLITKIIMENMEQNLDLLPKNITESTVIHLRLGDVVAGNEFHEKSKRPFEINYIKSLLADDINPKYLIGKIFFAKTSSTNYEECINLSNEYLNNMINELQAVHFNSGNPDIDLYCAIKSKKFLQGRGYYSKLIVEIRKKLNLISIETVVCEPWETLKQIYRFIDL
jgi:hypothetical protein